MRPVALRELAGWLGVAAPEAERPVLRVQTDSRGIEAGDLFVALVGERSDGHDHVAEAAARGAVAALVERMVDAPIAQLQVASCLLGIGRIAKSLRDERTTRVLALTGSNGKTSVKTLLHAMLASHARCHVNSGNRNNELGMPLALIEQPEDVPFAVYEMGAGQPGDIDHLAAIARPHIALVNNIGPAHLERMGSLLGIARTKGAIYEHLEPDGVAVVNADDAFAPWFAHRARAAGRAVVQFGIDASADVVARRLRRDATGSHFELRTPWGAADVRLDWAGEHNVRNALAAAAMAGAAGAPLDAIVGAMQSPPRVAGRLTRRLRRDGGVLIDDSYNANPASTFAAITILAGMPAARRWLVLGDMRELGPDAAELHAATGRGAAAAGIDALWATGEMSAHAVRAFGDAGRWFERQDALIDALRNDLRPTDLVLVKGSRGSRMDRVVDALVSDGEVEHAA